MPRKLRKGRRRAQLNREKVNSLGRGLNNFVSDTLINNSESSDLQNVEFIEAGAVTKRSGFEQTGDSFTNNPKGLGSYTTDSNNYLLTVDGTALKYLNGSTWTSISGASFTDGNEIVFTQARGDLYIWEKDLGGAQLDDTLTLSRPGTMPKAKFAIFYQGYHFAAGVGTQRNRLYISLETDAADFTNGSTNLNNSTEVPGATVFAGTGAQFVDVNKDDGDFITGLAKFQDVLIIFKERSTFQLTLDADGIPTVSSVNQSIGCVSHKSIENVENDVFFLSREGVYILGNEPEFFNAIRTNELSARVAPTLDTISALNYTKANAIYFDNKYILAIPVGGSTINQVLTYDRRFLGWSKYSGFIPNSMTAHIDTATNEEHLYFADDNDTKVNKVTDGVYTDNNTAINAYWTSKAFDLGDFDVQKRFVYLDLFFRRLRGTIKIQVYTDNDELVKDLTINAGNTNAGIGISQFGGELIGGQDAADSSSAENVTNVPYRIIVNKTARTIKVRVTSDRNNESFVLHQLAIGFYPRSSFIFDSSRKLQ